MEYDIDATMLWFNCNQKSVKHVASQAFVEYLNRQNLCRFLVTPEGEDFESTTRGDAMNILHEGFFSKHNERELEILC